MNLLTGIALMPSLIIRSEPYILCLKLLGYSYEQAILLNLTGTSMAVVFWFFVVCVLPSHITFERFTKNNKVINWHKEKQRQNHKKAEKIINWLNQKKLSFMLPIIIFLMAAMPLIPIPLPLPLIAITLIRIANYHKRGLTIVLIANALKSYILVSAIYEVF